MPDRESIVAIHSSLRGFTPVVPVSLEQVRAPPKFLSPVIKTMLSVLVATGMAAVDNHSEVW